MPSLYSTRVQHITDTHNTGFQSHKCRSTCHSSQGHMRGTAAPARRRPAQWPRGWGIWSGPLCSAVHSSNCPSVSVPMVKREQNKWPDSSFGPLSSSSTTPRCLHLLTSIPGPGSQRTRASLNTQWSMKDNFGHVELLCSSVSSVCVCARVHKHVGVRVHVEVWGWNR